MPYCGLVDNQQRALDGVRMSWMRLILEILL